MSTFKKTALALIFGFAFSACHHTQNLNSQPGVAINKNAAPNAIAIHYADMAHAVFQDSLAAAQELKLSVEHLIEKPSEVSLEQAKANWKIARIPYQQSEVFRFGNPVVDDWEGQVNAWPLDEGLIDYVSNDYEYELGNVGATLNLIANQSITVGNTTIDASTLTPKLLASLNELGGSEANVTTGYHAIEFLLWGQDLNGVEPGAGARPFTDFLTGGGCTNGHCKRRGDYLKAVSDLLIEDLEYMVSQWAPKQANNYRAEFLALSQPEALRRIFFGMGSLALGELSGERIKVALVANSTEDEHDCFSDNTHYSHYYNAKGIENVYFGQYQRLNGDKLKGQSIHQRLKSLDPTLAQAVKETFDHTMASMDKLVVIAERQPNPEKFDQLIAENNTEGHALLSEIIEALVDQTRHIELAAKGLKLESLRATSYEE